MNFFSDTNACYDKYIACYNSCMEHGGPSDACVQLCVKYCETKWTCRKFKTIC